MNVERNKKIILTGIGILFFSIFSYTALLSINIDCKYDDCKLTIDKNATLGQIAYVIEDKLNLNPIVLRPPEPSSFLPFFLFQIGFLLMEYIFDVL